jgi:hypothetical protein
MAYVAGSAEIERHSGGVLFVEASNLDRLLNEVEECLRLAAISTNPADREAWVHLAEDWMRLARAAREREI